MTRWKRRDRCGVVGFFSDVFFISFFLVLPVKANRRRKSPPPHVAHLLWMRLIIGWYSPGPAFSVVVVSGSQSHQRAVRDVIGLNSPNTLPYTK